MVSALFALLKFTFPQMVVREDSDTDDEDDPFAPLSAKYISEREQRNKKGQH